jgi:bleomycin hydrolase
MKIIKTVSLLAVAAWSISLSAQDKTNKKESQIKFTVVKEAQCTSVKDQFHSGTCWIFSTESFLESEFMRMGKGQVDLSEMWIVRAGYLEKAKKYMRMMGKTNFGPGGEAIDVINLSAQYGIVPQSVYPGLPEGESKIRHGELDEVLKAILDAQLKLTEGKLSPNWLMVFTAALDAYLGAPVKDFKVDGKTYTPQTYAAFLGFNAADYVPVTSFTHHPFYTQFALEVPDNWAWYNYYNVPMEDMMSIINNATMNGYTVGWGADVSEPYFSYKNGMAIVPEKEMADMTQGEKDSLWLVPSKDKLVTQLLRQQSFDDLSTQDDHGMQITGQAKDQTGKKYYIIKNSWGTKNDLGGYFYASENYIAYKTTSILVHKSAIPTDIAGKMGITQKMSR